MSTKSQEESNPVISVPSRSTKKGKKGVKKGKNVPWFTDGSWTFFENKKYVKFVADHLKLFSNYHERRVKKVFEKMANRISTRNSQQCRSHHQKMVMKYGS